MPLSLNSNNLKLFTQIVGRDALSTAISGVSYLRGDLSSVMSQSSLVTEVARGLKMEQTAKILSGISTAYALSGAFVDGAKAGLESGSINIQDIAAKHMRSTIDLISSSARDAATSLSQGDIAQAVISGATAALTAASAPSDILKGAGVEIVAGITGALLKYELPTRTKFFADTMAANGMRTVANATKFSIDRFKQSSEVPKAKTLLAQLPDTRKDRGNSGQKLI